jgi:hypothetical protein
MLHFLNTLVDGALQQVDPNQCGSAVSIGYSLANNQNGSATRMMPDIHRGMKPGIAMTYLS